MFISVITYLFRDQSTPEMAERVHRLGFRRIELDFRHSDGRCDYHQADEAQADETRRLLADFGLTPESYCIGGFTPEDRGSMERAFAFARGLGVDLLTGVAHPAVLDQIDALCGQYHLRFAIENHHGHSFASADDLLPALVRHSDQLGVNFDSGHFHAGGLEVVEQARKLRGRIYHVHLKDSDQAKPLGQGTVGVLGLLDELRAQQYAGALSIEQGEQEGVAPEALDGILRDSLALLRSILKT